jgi:O-antigen ligase
MAAVGRFLLLIALAASPWAFGCVQPWPQFVLGAVVAGLAVLRAIEAIVVRPDQSAHVPLAATAPLVLLVIAAVQLLPQEVPLPSRMHHAVFGADAPLFEPDHHDATGTLSAASTRREAARLFLALAAFVLAAQWFADLSTHRSLLAVLAFNGAALGGFGIIQRLSWNGLLFWSVELRHGGTPFASYVNRNNAAGYLNLCLGAAIGLSLLIWWKPRRTGVRLTRFADRVRLAVAQLDGVKLTVLALLIVTTAGVLFSLSRGGIVALAVAAVAVIVGTFRGASRGGLLLLGVLIFAAAVGLVYYSGQFELVDERIETLSDPLQAAAGRLQHWSDTAGVLRDFPLLGTGLGTYRYANLPYQQQPAHAWYYNADNQWFEILIEGGFAALTAALLGLLLICACAVSLLRRGDPLSRAMGACGLFVVLSQGIQAVTDFGLTLPANAVTFAVLSGAVCGSACRTAQFERIRIPLWLSLVQLDGRAAQTLLSVVLAVVGGAFLLELYTATTADAARDDLIAVEPDRTPLPALDDQISRLEQALTLRPDDGSLHLALARTYVDRCQLALYQRLLQENPAADARQRRQQWRSVAVGTLGRRTRQLAAAGNRSDLDRLRRIGEIQQNLGPARGHFEQAVRHSPLTPGAAMWLARLEGLAPADGSSQGLQPLAKARFVAPSDPQALFELATLAEMSGEREFAADSWRRGLALVPAQAPAVWEQLLMWHEPADALATAVPDRVDVLVEIAEHAQDPQLRQSVADRADEVLLQQQSAVDPLSAARLAELQSRPEQAIHNYRLELSLNPWDSTTRLRLARLLDRQGRLSEAVMEYSLLRQQLPNRKDIQDEFAALRVRELDVLARPPEQDAGTTPYQPDRQ